MRSSRVSPAMYRPAMRRTIGRGTAGMTPRTVLWRRFMPLVYGDRPCPASGWTGRRTGRGSGSGERAEGGCRTGKLLLGSPGAAFEELAQPRVHEPLPLLLVLAHIERALDVLDLPPEALDLPLARPLP